MDHSIAYLNYFMRIVFRKFLFGNNLTNQMSISYEWKRFLLMDSLFYWDSNICDFFLSVLLAITKLLCYKNVRALKLDLVKLLFGYFAIHFRFSYSFLTVLHVMRIMFQNESIGEMMA
jgi:hypothetical protein